MLEKLTNGLDLMDLSQALGTTTSTPKEMVEFNSTIEPHVFYISPDNLTVCPVSHFMRVYIDRVEEQS